MVSETSVQPRQLVLPMFVREGITEPVPIGSMPGVVQHSRDSLVAAAVAAAELGLGGVMLSGVPESKDVTGSGAPDPSGIPNAAVRIVLPPGTASPTVMAGLGLSPFIQPAYSP